MSSFVAALSTFANTFSQLQDAAGIVGAQHGGGPDIAAGAQEQEGVPYLKIGIDASGRLKFSGVSGF